jgi:hypothetical protein
VGGNPGNPAAVPQPKANKGAGRPLRAGFPVKQPSMPANDFGPFMPGFSGGQGGTGNFSGGSFMGSFNGGLGMGGGSGFGGGGMMGGSMGSGNGRIGGGSIMPIPGQLTYPGGMGQTGGGMMGMAGGNPGQRTSDGKRMPLIDWARKIQSKPGALTKNRDGLEQNAQQTKTALDQAGAALAKGQHAQTQEGQLGVDLSVQSNQLRDQTRLTLSAQRKAAGRTLLEIGGVWIDEGFDPKMKAWTIKAFSPAYFRLHDRQIQLRELFRLGNYLVWVTPSGSALVIDREDGRENVDDLEIERLFRESKR